MRKNLYLYLFVFASLFAIYFYITGDKMLASKENEIQALEKEIENNNSAELTSEEIAPDTFSLLSNEEALTYLENRGFTPQQVITRVEDELIANNTAASDNKYIPYEGMNGPFRISKVKVLNHKWAIASFTDGTYWGEIFLSFELDDQGQLRLQTEKAVLYSNN